MSDFEVYIGFNEIITRDDLLSVGIDPSQYLSEGKNEIMISDIVAAAKSNKDDYENLFNNELSNTSKILDAYNKSSKAQKEVRRVVNK